ncbi:MAG: Thioesterase superfamily [Bacteroidetes bacterium]|nr:Thioesterase superfamily [Bacteroidota bacterium]
MTNFTQQHIVTEKETAMYFGSGSLEVFATPAMVALMENTAINMIDDLNSDFTTVGIEINVQHKKASKVGETVICTVELVNHERKLYEFSITVTNIKGEQIGTATHKRVAVQIEKFMSSL